MNEPCISCPLRTGLQFLKPASELLQRLEAQRCHFDAAPSFAGLGPKNE